MVSPRSVAIHFRHDTRFHKPGNELIQWESVGEAAHLYIEMVKGNGDIAWIPHDINNTRITRVKRFVTFKHSRQGCQSTVRQFVDRWHLAFNVGEGNRFLLGDKISHQKSRPGITGARIRNEENIVRHYSD